MNSTSHITVASQVKIVTKNTEKRAVELNKLMFYFLVIAPILKHRGVKSNLKKFGRESF